MKKILTIAAHPDDEVLGCGGTLLKHRKNNDEIYIIFLADGVSSRENYKLKEITARKKQAKIVGKKIKAKKLYFLNLPDNKLDSIPLLNLIKKIEKIIKVIRPNIIYTHSYCDLNIDHRRAFEATMTACRPDKKSPIEEIYSFEIPSSTNLHHPKSMIFKPNYYVDISSQIKLKKNLLEVYKNELKKKISRSIKNVITLSKTRGSQSGCDYAEAFEVVRILK
tara:strand:- start:270 stop:935 length:666 start_codon:yes stop_codon:yes gene_type:complete